MTSAKTPPLGLAAALPALQLPALEDFDFGPPVEVPAELRRQHEQAQQARDEAFYEGTPRPDRYHATYETPWGDFNVSVTLVGDEWNVWVTGELDMFGVPVRLADGATTHNGTLSFPTDPTELRVLRTDRGPVWDFEHPLKKQRLTARCQRLLRAEFERVAAAALADMPESERERLQLWASLLTLDSVELRSRQARANVSAKLAEIADAYAKLAELIEQAPQALAAAVEQVSTVDEAGRALIAELSNRELVA